MLTGIGRTHENYQRNRKLTTDWQIKVDFLSTGENGAVGNRG